MGRIVFVFLVLIGAMALVLALVVGAGMVGLARDTALPAPAVARATGTTDGPTVGAPANPPSPPVLAAAAAAGSNAWDPIPAGLPPVVNPRPQAPLPPDAPPVAANAPGVVTALTIVKADGVDPVTVLKDGMAVSLAGLPTRRVSVKADVGGRVRSVRFVRDGGKDGPHVENAPPFTVLGDTDNKCYPWDLTPGDHSVTATPFPEPDGKGPAGPAVTVRFTVLGPPAGGGVVLSAATAARRGRMLQVLGGQDGQEPNISFWRQPDEYIEWAARPPTAGLYRVELTYACDAHDGGGEYELLVGRHRFTGTSGPTGGWTTYRTVEVGRLTLPADGVTVALKPTKLEGGRALMKVRSVRLVAVQ